MHNILVCLFELMIGILLLIDPVSFNTGVIILIGVGLLIYGVINIVQYFRADKQEASQGQQLSTGLIALIVGAFFAFRSAWILLTFPVITAVYGVVVLLTGMVKIQWTVDLLRLKSKKWFLRAISAVLSIVCGILIISNPFASTAALWMFIGISLIVEAIFDVAALIFGNRAVNTGYTEEE